MHILPFCTKNKPNLCNYSCVPKGSLAVGHWQNIQINYNTLYYNLKLYNQKPSKHTRKREKYDDIINDYQNLISIKDIAKKYNLCEGQIRRILHENNIELRSKKLEASENQKKVMNMLINEGLSQAEVARRLNVSRQCISKLYLKCKEKNIQW